MKFLDFVKLMGAAVAGMVALTSFYSGFVSLVGGRVVPWYSKTEIEGIIDSKLTGVTARLDWNDAMNNRQLCEDYTDRLIRGRAALDRNPADMTAKDLIFVASQKILSIPGCKI